MSELDSWMGSSSKRFAVVLHLYSWMALRERHRGNPPRGQSFCRCMWHPHSGDRDNSYKTVYRYG